MINKDCPAFRLFTLVQEVSKGDASTHVLMSINTFGISFMNEATSELEMFRIMPMTVGVDMGVKNDE